MSMFARTCRVLPAAFVALSLFGCDEKKTGAEAPAVTTTAPTATVPPTPSSAPTPATITRKPSHECPEGTEGEGTFKAPCIATDDSRLMEVKWTGKITDKGPSFRVVNNTKLEILYGQVIVYFYDKAGKQLQVPGGGSDGEGKPKQKCSGNIFAGPMKPGEKAVLWFSCVKKDHVPEGTETIEAEMRIVGFTGEDGKRADTYWRNESFTPDERPKGGVKKKK